MKKPDFLNSYYWKEHIYKDDLKSVLINGFLIAIFVGILGGVCDYAMGLINFSISISFILLYYFMSTRLKKAYFTYHILYPVLSLVFLTLGFMIADFTYLFIGIRDLSAFYLFTSPYYYFYFITKPISNIILFFNSGNSLDLILGIINLVIVIWAYVYVYKTVKGNN